jgi:single-stranded DNA-binding protein
MNSVTLFGHLEEGPRLMGMPGRDVCEFWLCVPTRTERHALHVKVVTFQQLAESCAERLRSGDQVGVTGHLRSDEVPQGPRRRLIVHTVIGRQVDFVERRASREPD